MISRGRSGLWRFSAMIGLLMVAIGGSSDSSWAHTSPSLAQLAQKKVVPTFDTLLNELDLFNESTLPHEAKNLRKLIGTARDFLDLFAPVYPSEQILSEDPWIQLRKELDEGYEEMGIFKDLFDSQGPNLDPASVEYDLKEVKRLRKTVLRWKDRFLSEPKISAYRRYIGSPDPYETYRRPRKAQSQFYWGTARVAASAKLSGLENLGALLRDVIDAAKDDYREIKTTRELFPEKYAIRFHDFRKRIRTIVKIVGHFPMLIIESPSASSALTRLQTLVDQYGAINDLIVAHGKALQVGKNKKAEALEKQIHEDWKTLRKWQESVEIRDVLNCLDDVTRANGTLT